MKDLKENYLAKLIMVIAVIFTMLFSAVAPIISYAVEIPEGIEHVTSDNDYVKFDVNWANGGKDLTMNNGATTARFTIQFDTIDKFTDFRIVVEKSQYVTATFDNTGEYYGATTPANQMQYINTVPGGTRLSGTINFTFSRPKDYSDYTRNINVKLYGIYKDKDGKIYAVNPTCTHLGCLLTWNNVDKTWDCPCHGSRFCYNGKNLSDPAFKDLETFGID